MLSSIVLYPIHLLIKLLIETRLLAWSLVLLYVGFTNKQVNHWYTGSVFFSSVLLMRIHRRKLCVCNFKESAIVGINPRPQPLEPYTLPLVYMAAYVLVQIGHDWTIFYLFGGSVQINKSIFLIHFVNFSLVTSYNSCWCLCKWDENNKTTFLMLLRMHIWLELHQQEPGPRTWFFCWYRPVFI